MAGFPKTGKMAIYNIQLFGKGGEVLVYKLNGKQHAYAESIPKEQLVDEVTKSDNICYYRSNTPLFHIHDACLLYTSQSQRDATLSRMPSSA